MKERSWNNLRISHNAVCSYNCDSTTLRRRYDHATTNDRTWRVYSSSSRPVTGRWSNVNKSLITKPRKTFCVSIIIKTAFTSRMKLHHRDVIRWRHWSTSHLELSENRSINERCLHIMILLLNSIVGFPSAIWCCWLGDRKASGL